MGKMESNLIDGIKKYVVTNRGVVRVGCALLLIFIGFSACEGFARIASGEIGDGVIIINAGYEMGFKVSLVTLGIYLLIKNLLVEIILKK